MQISVSIMMRHKNKRIWYIWDGEYTSDRIDIAGRTGGCRVDSLRCSQQYMPLCGHRLVNPNFAPLKRCIYEFAQRIKDKWVVIGEKKLFLDSISQIFSNFVDILENIISRSWSYILQLIKKWRSSTPALQHGHTRSVMGVLGLVYLPRSISNGCELARSLLIATLYLASFTWYKYISLHDIL